MFDSAAATGRKRLVGGVLAAGLQAALAALLVYGLAAPGFRAGVQTALTSLDLRTPPPPPPPPPPQQTERHAKPPALAARRAQAAPVVAPSVAPLKPPVIPAAPVADQGVAANSGAAAAGNGTGAGGAGSGTGGGGEGNGDGDAAALVSGQIKPSDTPGKMFDAPFTGTTRVLVLIDAGGAVSDCRTQRSSGNAMLDALTCRLITTRFRFRPARDSAGRAIAGRIIYEHEWEVGGGFDSDPPG